MKETSIADRKRDHIERALTSQHDFWSNDRKFNYEPMLGKHTGSVKRKIDFLGHKMQFPLWVSSMTGGTPEARKINENLAKACGEFGLGMGLGSCRALLEDPQLLPEFDMRHLMGKQPLFANLGIAQIEKSLKKKEIAKIEDMVGLLQADGLIIHVNPFQEWLQPEGDKITKPAFELIESFLSLSKLPVIVKEVGQGMGPESLRCLMKLPVAIEFGAYGGTNFSQLEISRRSTGAKDLKQLAHVGHNYDEMIELFNQLLQKKEKRAFKGVIVSGGISGFLDGYYAVSKLNTPCVYGQASALLNGARISYEALKTYIEEQINGYNLASEYLTLRS